MRRSSRCGLDIEVGGAESGKAACASVSLPPEFPDGLAMVLVECDGYDPLLIPVLKMGDAPPERAERRMFLSRIRRAGVRAHVEPVAEGPGPPLPVVGGRR